MIQTLWRVQYYQTLYLGGKCCVLYAQRFPMMYLCHLFCLLDANPTEENMHIHLVFKGLADVDFVTLNLPLLKLSVDYAGI